MATQPKPKTSGLAAFTWRVCFALLIFYSVAWIIDHELSLGRPDVQAQINHFKNGAFETLRNQYSDIKGK